jgi:hypothetical protein
MRGVVLMDVQEITQSMLALTVILATVAIIFIRGTVPTEWWTLAALVVGYYFGARGRSVSDGVGVAAGVTLFVLGARAVVSP